MKAKVTFEVEGVNVAPRVGLLEEDLRQVFAGPVKVTSVLLMGSAPEYPRTQPMMRHRWLHRSALDGEQYEVAIIAPSEGGGAIVIEYLEGPFKDQRVLVDERLVTRVSP